MPVIKGASKRSVSNQRVDEPKGIQDAAVIAVDERVGRIIQDAPIKYKEQKQPKVWEYRVTKPSGIVTFISTRTMAINPQTGQLQELRYAENEPSVWVNEQGEFPLVKPVVMRDGLLFVESSRMNLKTFLDLHPDNVANGGSQFELVQNEKTADVELAAEWDISEAVAMVKNKDINELLPVAKHYGIDINQSILEIRLELVKIAKSRSKDFMNQLNNPLVKIKAYISAAEQLEIIKVTQDTISWFDTLVPIINNLPGKDPVETFALFLASDKGADALDSIKAQVNSLSK